MWLIALTCGLGLAVIALAALTLHRARLERRRSDARVAALAAAIDDPHWTAGDLEDYPAEVLPPSPGVSLVVPDVKQPSRAPAFVAAALVIIGASSLLVAGLNGGSRAARHVAAPASSIEHVSMRH